MSAAETLERAAAFTGRMAKIVGPARSGKTEALIRQCVRLVKEGGDPAGILVATSTAFAADAFRARLRAALGDEGAEAADRVTVQPALDAILDALDKPEARAATGRVPRILSKSEYNFLLEDLKTTGAPLRKLRAMLAYFSRLNCDLVPREKWNFGGGEESVFEHLVGSLTLRKAMLAHEAGALCADYLRSDAGTTGRGAFSAVLADDFQNLSHAEQTCLCLLARDRIVVAGNADETVPTASGRPYPEGFARFDALRHGVEVFELSSQYGDARITNFVNALAHSQEAKTARKAAEDTGAKSIADPGVIVLKWNTPDEELKGLATIVRSLVDRDGLLERDLCVLVPSKQWGKLAARALTEKGISVSASGACAGIGGNPQDSSRAKALVAYTKLNLAADPRDVTAWRSWCGFDNYLTNSEVWDALERLARERKSELYDTLEAVATKTIDVSSIPRAQVLSERWESGQHVIAQNAERRGFALLRGIGAAGLPEFADVERLMEGSETAAETFAIARDAIASPTFDPSPHAVRIASYDAMPGTSYDTVIAIGAIDGLIPPRSAFETVSTDEQRAQALNAARTAFYGGVAKATRRLVVSYFSKVPLELAEQAKMQVLRVRAENGERVAAVRPTTFLSMAEAACPSVMGGQAALSSLASL